MQCSGVEGRDAAPLSGGGLGQVGVRCSGVGGGRGARQAGVQCSGVGGRGAAPMGGEAGRGAPADTTFPGSSSP